jgi:hypothetical protein
MLLHLWQVTEALTPASWMNSTIHDDFHDDFSYLQYTDLLPRRGTGADPYRVREVCLGVFGHCPAATP